MATSVLKDERALDPEHVPETLQHRDGALAELRSALQPIADGFRPKDAAIFGPSGAGKTTIAKHIVAALERSLPRLDWGYVDAMGNASRRNAYYQLARDCGGVYPREGNPTARFAEDLRDREEPAVLIVDEVSFLEEPIRTLVPLYRASNVALITITLSENDWLAGLDHRVAKHARGATRVRLDAYGHDELRDIVAHRVRLGLEPGVVADGAAEAVATLAEGDARFAIELLAGAARRVRSGDAERVTPAVVRGCEATAREEIQSRYAENLDTHHRLLYTIVQEAGEIRARDVHQAFLDRVEGSSPPAKRTRTRYLEALRNYELIELVGDAGASTYRIA